MYFLLLLNNSLEVLEATSFPFRYVLGFPFAKSIDSLIQQRHLTSCYKCRHKIDIFKTVHCCVAILKSSKIFLDKLQSMTPVHVADYSPQKISKSSSLDPVNALKR